MTGTNPRLGAAAVIPFTTRPVAHDNDRSAALQVAAACPGWRAWRGQRDGQWHARRTIGSCQNLDDGRAYLVSAPDLPGLLAAIEQQALLDIAAECPDWNTAQTGTGRWWAVRNGAAARRTSLVYADTAMALLSALRGLEAHRLPPLGAAQ